MDKDQPLKFGERANTPPVTQDQSPRESERTDALADVVSKALTVNESLWLKQLAPTLKSLQTLQIAVARAAVPRIDLARTLVSLMPPLRQWYEGFAPFAQFLSNFQREVAPVFERLATVVPQLEDLLKNLQQLIVEEKETTEAFKNGHLLLVPSMPVQLVRQTTSLCKNGEFKKATHLVGNYYRKSEYAALTCAVNQWGQSRSFRPRMRIILDALGAHKRREYSLSVPALLPQIEGTASDISRTADNVISKYEKLQVRNKKARLGKTKAVISKLVEDSSPKLGIGHGMHETLRAFIEEPLYKSRNFEEDYNAVRKYAGLSRHGILHGLQIRYASYPNSLRLFLVLDILSYIAQRMEEQSISLEKKRKY